MRLSFRRAVKLAAVIASVFVIYALVGFQLPIASFKNFEKVLGQRTVRDSHNGEPLVFDGPAYMHLSHNHDSHLRQQRSAKSVPQPANNSLVERLNPRINKQVDSIVLLQKANVSATSANQTGNLTLGRESSHGSVTGLADLFISVKTSGKFHASRLQLMLQTWFLLAREQIYIFTDENDAIISETTGRHLINTNCSSGHTRQALCCKMSVEFDAYLASRKRWLCHFDDDTYVNIPALIDLLQQYKHTEDWYLGKPSLRHPMEINDPDHHGVKISFWFATGSGFCISRGLALKMMPHAGGGRLMAVGEKLRLPDDCVIGYIIEHLLRKQLTVIEGFRSHLEALRLIKPHHLKKQITLSYSTYQDKANIVNVPGFSDQDDPTRLLSVHCYLFPTFKQCREIQH